MHPRYPSGVPTAITSTLVRPLAVAAGVAVAAGAVLLGGAVVVHQGWWYAGFVSEAGEPGSPQAEATPRPFGVRGMR